MADAQQMLVLGTTIATILFAFVVVPELLERAGVNPRSVRARAIIWGTFLGLVFLPAAITGFLFTVTNPWDWLFAVGFLIVAMLWDYYRLNPDKVPWARRSV